MVTPAPTRQPCFPPALGEAFAWLAAVPAADPLRDLAPLRRHLKAAATLGVPPLQYLKLIELFQARAEAVAAAVQPLLLEATLPLAKQLRTIARGLMSVYATLAAGYLHSLHALAREKLRDLNLTPDDLSARGLDNLLRQYEVALCVCAPPQRDFWMTVHAFQRQIDAASVIEGSASILQMKALLALAAAQPDGFSPRETAFLAAYLRLQAAAVELQDSARADATDAFWFDAALGLPPAATVRRAPPGAATRYYSCAELSRLARNQIARLEQGERPATLGLPSAAGTSDYREVLALAAARWAQPPRRQGHRRSHGDRLQACTQLGALWQQLGAGADDLATSDWMIVNESPGGYAIMHVAGVVAGLVAGSAIGVRGAADKPWNICLVRWARSENPEHLELGLELVAPQAAAVRIVRRDATATQTPLPALLLPPLPALRRGEALLTPRGHFTPGRFALIDESHGRVQVAECTAAHLSTHTARVEIFEFERDLADLTRGVG